MIDRKRIILACGIIVLVIALSVVVIILSNMRFRLVDSSPKGNTFPTSSNELAFMFNKPLDTSKPTKDDVSINPATDFTISVDNKTLKIAFVSAPATDFTITISHVTSKNNNTIAVIKRSFRVEYVAYKNLSDYEKSRQISQSDNFTTVYPIINQLPISTSEYTITYEMPASTSTATGQSSPLVLKVAILKTDASYADVTDIMLKIYADLRVRGFDPNDYYIMSDYDAPL